MLSECDVLRAVGLTNIIKMECDCRPGDTAVSSALREPKYQQTAAYCHFGREVVPENEYNEFYAGSAEDFLEPFAHTHVNLVGEIEFMATTYLPKKAPFVRMNNYGTKKSEGNIL